MFRNTFSFEGRIRRTEYGLSLLIVYAWAFITGGLMVLAESEIMILLLIPNYWFLFAQGAKRCHDRGNSGWYMFIPLYGLWMLFAEGDKGPNKYGADPKEMVLPETVMALDTVSESNS